MTVKNYNPNDVEVFFCGKKINGFSDGTFINAGDEFEKSMRREVTLIVRPKTTLEDLIDSVVDEMAAKGEIGLAMLFKWQRITMQQTQQGGAE